MIKIMTINRDILSTDCNSRMIKYGLFNLCDQPRIGNYAFAFEIIVFMYKGVFSNNPTKVDKWVTAGSAGKEGVEE